MRKAFLLLLALSLLTGCPDEKAKTYEEARKDFDNALTLVDEAEKGFVDQKDGESASDTWSEFYEKTDLTTHRQETFKKASEELKKVIANGTEREKIAARRLMADLYASAARDKLREALTNSAEVASRGATGLSFVNAVDRADSRIQMLNGDEGPLIEKLDERKRQARAEIEKYTQDVAAREAKIRELDGGIADHTKKRDAAQLAAAQLQRDAAGKNADVQTKMQIEAIAKQREADKNASDAELLGVSLVAQKSELAILRHQLERWEKVEQEATTQIAAAQSARRMSGSCVIRPVKPRRPRARKWKNA